MLVQELINLINLEADELLDEDTDNIPYINQAIDYLSFTLCGMGDPEIINVMDISSNVDVPSNFVDFVPHNGYPLYIQNNKFWVTTSSGLTLNKVKYSISKAHVSTVSDTIPFNDMYAGTLVLIASYMIKKKTYIPVEYCNEDLTFVQAVLASIKAAKGGK